MTERQQDFSVHTYSCARPISWSVSAITLTFPFSSVDIPGRFVLNTIIIFYYHALK